MRWWAGLALLFAAGQAHAYQWTNTFELKNFRLDGITVLQSGGFSTSLEIGWSPRYIISEDWSIGIYPAVGFLKESGASTAIAMKGDVLIGWEPVLNLWVEAGPGYRYWTTTTRLSSPSFSANLVWKLFLDPILGIDRLFAGWSYVTSAQPVHEIRLGIQITL
jgi:hypothetical protein